MGNLRELRPNQRSTAPLAEKCKTRGSFPGPAVLWIRIRLDLKLFAGYGAGSVIINFGSGSYELQFLVTKIA